MNLLADTHAFIWSFSDTKKLSPIAAAEFKNPANQIFLSVASVWEMQIKIKLGQMVFADTLENIINEQQSVNSIQILPVQLAHALYLEKLPYHHKDPFDRLLISQAIVENLTLVSTDRAISLYPVKLLW